MERRGKARLQEHNHGEVKELMEMSIIGEGIIILSVAFFGFCAIANMIVKDKEENK